MSHYYFLRCDCGAESDKHNQGREQLAAAAKASYPLWLAHRAGWNTADMRWEHLPGDAIGPFLAEHYDHGGYTVVSEYATEDDPRPEYQALRIFPDGPHAASSANHLITEQGKILSRAIRALAALQDEEWRRRVGRPGKCGMPSHHETCECGGAGGDR